MHTVITGKKGQVDGGNGAEKESKARQLVVSSKNRKSNTFTIPQECNKPATQIPRKTTIIRARQKMVWSAPWVRF